MLVVVEVTEKGGYRSSGGIRPSNIRTTVEVAKILVCGLAIRGSELVGEDLCAHTIDTNSKVPVRYR